MGFDDADYSNWVRMDDVGEVAEGLNASASFYGPSADDAVERARNGRTSVEYQGSGLKVVVREDGVEYGVFQDYNSAAVEEFARLILPRSDDVNDEFAEEVARDIEAYDSERLMTDGGQPYKADGGYTETMSDVSHKPPEWTNMDNPSL